jgi:hypothetical protein
VARRPGIVIVVRLVVPEMVQWVYATAGTPMHPAQIDCGMLGGLRHRDAIAGMSGKLRMHCGRAPSVRAQ